MDPTYSRRRIFIHVCPPINKHMLQNAYWLNAINGLEDLAERHERMAGDIIRQVTNTPPEQILRKVAARYGKLTGIKYTDVGHFIIDLYVTSNKLIALYVRRDLNFVPKGNLEPLIELPEFRDVPLSSLNESGKSIQKAVGLAKTMIHNHWLSSILKTFCYTYVPTHLLYLFISYFIGNQQIALFSAAIIPTVVFMITLPCLVLHFRKMRKTNFITSPTIIPLSKE